MDDRKMLQAACKQAELAMAAAEHSGAQPSSGE